MVQQSGLGTAVDFCWSPLGFLMQVSSLGGFNGAVISWLYSGALHGLTYSRTSFYISLFSSRLDFLTAWNLISKRENSKMSSAYQISACITLANVLFAKASHKTKLRFNVEGTTQRQEFSEAWFTGGHQCNCPS